MGVDGFILYALVCILFGMIGYKQGKEAGYKKAERENIQRLRKMNAERSQEGTR